jgi:hypothetical protein
MNGSAYEGVSPDASRVDHVHPSDTSRAGLGANTFTGHQTLPGGGTGNQAVTATELATKANTSHTHTLANITDAGSAASKSTGTTAGTVPLVGTKSATTLLAGLVELAIQAEAEAGTDNTVVMTPLTTAQALAARETRVTIATTGAAVFDFTGIPSGTEVIVLGLNGTSHNGTSTMLVQLGTGGAPTTSGYVSHGEGMDGPSMTSFKYTTGFGISDTSAAARSFHGQLILTHMGSNVWVMSGGAAATGDSYDGSTCAGDVTLAGELDFLRFTSVSGGTFDGGSVTCYARKTL